VPTCHHLKRRPALPAPPTNPPRIGRARSNAEPLEAVRPVSSDATPARSLTPPQPLPTPAPRCGRCHESLTRSTGSCFLCPGASLSRALLLRLRLHSLPSFLFPSLSPALGLASLLHSYPLVSSVSRYWPLIAWQLPSAVETSTGVAGGRAGAGRRRLPAPGEDDGACHGGPPARKRSRSDLSSLLLPPTRCLLSVSLSLVWFGCTWLFIRALCSVPLNFDHTVRLGAHGLL
jgi:hypothetical protein